ncbi:hypothetical protein VP01_403g3 [Puccinia sorghi]|uniref:Uncharacterized protein n=1 Tax=Puccinia sorghi TaxID=27349 RepID=A0A0L6URS9_9BASI|nr:hypothetical protein VP01_403g3 [Puccinia sorghi]
MTEGSVDWFLLDPSSISMTPRPSNELPRPTSTPVNQNFSATPVNRIVIEPATTRRKNYPQFNQKPLSQDGPRVIRINSQSDSSQNPISPTASGSLPHSLRPTPIPHGGNVAAMSSRSQKPSNLAARFSFIGPPASKKSASPESFTTSWNSEQSNSDHSTYRELPHRSNLGFSEADLRKLAERIAHAQAAEAASSRAQKVELPSANAAGPASPLQLPTPQAETQPVAPIDRDGSTTNSAQPGEPHHQSISQSALLPDKDTSSSPLNSTTHETSTSTRPTAKPTIETKVAHPLLDVISSPTTVPLDLADFAYLFDQPDLLTPELHKSNLKRGGAILSKMRSCPFPTPSPLTSAPLTGSFNHSHVAPSPKSPIVSYGTSLTSGSRPPSSVTSPISREEAFSPHQNMGSGNHSPELSSLRNGNSTPARHVKRTSSMSSLHIKARPTLTSSADSPETPTESSTTQHTPPLPAVVAQTCSANTVSPSIAVFLPQLDNPLSPSSRPVLPRSQPHPLESLHTQVESQLELEQARQMILGLQNQVKQLEHASVNGSISKPQQVADKPPPPAPSTTPHLSITALPNDTPSRPSSPSESKLTGHNLRLKETVEGTDVDIATNVSPQTASLDNTAQLGSSSSAATHQHINSQPAQLLQHELPSENNDSLQVDDFDHKAEKIASQVLPSRLPIALHRLKSIPSTQFDQNHDSNVNSGGSFYPRNLKASLTSRGSIENRYDTPESYSTQLTSPSAISSISAPNRFNKVPSFKHAILSERVQVCSALGSHDDGLSRKRRNSNLFNYDFYPEKTTQSSRITGRPPQQEPRWQPSRPLHDSSTDETAIRSLSSSVRARVRPDPINSRAHRHQLSSSTNLQSIDHDEESCGSCSEIESSYERGSHSSSHRVPSRFGLDSVQSGNLNKVSLRLMTKPELLAVIKKQRVKLEDTHAAFAAERDDLLDTLAQTREREAELSRERERLLAEDAWKTEELSRAREEIAWLSRMADDLEIEKSRLETRANSMANELKRAVVDLRTASTASSQGLGQPSPRNVRTQTPSTYLSRTASGSQGTSDHIGKKKDKGSLAQFHRPRQQSSESADTVRRAVTKPNLQASKSHSNLNKSELNNWRGRQPHDSELPMASPRTLESRLRPRNSPAQRSVPDFRSPLSPLKFPSQRAGRAEKQGSRQTTFRNASLSRSVSSGSRSYMDEHDEVSSEERYGESVIMEEEQEEGGWREEAEWAENESENQRSRSSSLSSQAISPSSTVFADHHRDHRTAARSSGSSSTHQGGGFRSSLISLQLRPEDELFLENYLVEDGDDGLDTDIDY